MVFSFVLPSVSPIHNWQILQNCSITSVVCAWSFESDNPGRCNGAKREFKFVQSQHSPEFSEAASEPDSASSQPAAFDFAAEYEPVSS